MINPNMTNTEDTGPGNQPKIRDFDDILDLVGGKGLYQRRLVYFYIVPFSVLMSFFSLNIVFMLSEPDHWCHVPGRLQANLTLEEWKAQTIPLETGPDGRAQFSTCTMYSELEANGTRKVSSCSDGWDYDLRDYPGGTISTERNWVCDKGDYSTQALTANGVGNVLGAIGFGWAGDKIGRRLVIMLTLATNFVFRIGSLYLTEYFYVFLLMQVLVATSFPMVYVNSFALVAEVSATDYRYMMYAASWFTFVFGLCALPFLAWLLGSWFYIGLVTVLPLPFMLLYYKWLPESPRWLLGMGRLKEAEAVLLDIGRVNGRLEKIMEGDLLKILTELQKAQQKIENRHSLWSLFSKGRLIKHTLLLSLVWSINQMVYMGITLNTTSMGGLNEFLNFFILSIIELPTGILAGYLVEKAGRRWTQAGFFLTSTAGFIIATFGAQYSSNAAIILAVVVSKFSVSITSLVVTMQATEILPTPLRSTGTGFASTIGCISSIFSPYIIYLGRIHALIPYVFLATISAVGLISSALLPETLGQSLPETLEDANNLGRTEKFWSFLPKDYKVDRRKSFGVPGTQNGPKL